MVDDLEVKCMNDTPTARRAQASAEPASYVQQGFESLNGGECMPGGRKGEDGAREGGVGLSGARESPGERAQSESRTHTQAGAQSQPQSRSQLQSQDPQYQHPTRKRADREQQQQRHQHQWDRGENTAEEGHAANDSGDQRCADNLSSAEKRQNVDDASPREVPSSNLPSTSKPEEALVRPFGATVGSFLPGTASGQLGVDMEGKRLPIRHHVKDVPGASEVHPKGTTSDSDGIPIILDCDDSCDSRAGQDYFICDGDRNSEDDGVKQEELEGSDLELINESNHETMPSSQVGIRGAVNSPKPSIHATECSPALENGADNLSTEDRDVLDRENLRAEATHTRTASGTQTISEGEISRGGLGPEGGRMGNIPVAGLVDPGDEQGLHVSGGASTEKVEAAKRWDSKVCVAFSANPWRVLFSL